MSRIVRNNQNLYDGRHYHNATVALEKDFERRCAYCMIEESLADGFEIDHFFPKNPRGNPGQGSDNYENLYLSCHKCNQQKSNIFPLDLAEADLDDVVQAPDRKRFADPCREYDYGNHFVENRNGELEACTLCGAYHIQHLRLNRTYLINHRKRRAALVKLSNEIFQSIKDLRDGGFSANGLDLLEQEIEIRPPFFPCSRKERGVSPPNTCQGGCRIPSIDQ